MPESKTKTYPVKADGHEGWTIVETSDPFTEWRLCNARGNIQASVDAGGYLDLHRPSTFRAQAMVELLYRAGVLDDGPGTVPPWMLLEEDDGQDEE